MIAAPRRPRPERNDVCPPWHIASQPRASRRVCMKGNWIALADTARKTENEASATPRCFGAASEEEEECTATRRNRKIAAHRRTAPPATMMLGVSDGGGGGGGGGGFPNGSQLKAGRSIGASIGILLFRPRHEVDRSRQGTVSVVPQEPTPALRPPPNQRAPPLRHARIGSVKRDCACSTTATWGTRPVTFLLPSVLTYQ